ncbi:MAG: aldo/keto reductase [Chloroflexi bacterium]|nr:aldo/keto reductase [Chloroflexota bacterium]
MRYVSLAGAEVSVIGLGAWQFGSRGWGWGREFGRREALAIVERAIELGISLFDTAEVYGGGGSERLLGDALRDHRAQVYVASKVWPVHALRSQVRAAAERSLGRLQMDRIDLYQVHWPNPLAPISWTMAGMRDLLEAGRIGAVGVSNFGLDRWRRADAALGAPVPSNQVRYNLLQRDPERGVLPFAREEGRTIIAYSPLAQGLLSGRYDAGHVPGGVRRFNPLFTRENLDRVRPVLDVLGEVARAHAATPAQIALAWVVARPGVVAIPGAKTLEQVEQNAAAAEIELSADEMAALEAASRGFTPAGRLRSAAAMAGRLLSAPFSVSGAR